MWNHSKTNITLAQFDEGGWKAISLDKILEKSEEENFLMTFIELKIYWARKISIESKDYKQKINFQHLNQPSTLHFYQFELHFQWSILFSIVTFNMSKKCAENKFILFSQKNKFKKNPLMMEHD